MTSDADTSRPPDHRAPNDRSKAKHFRPDIEGLRAVAVLAVLVFHAGVPFASGGYVGVDVFFVISGFLITGLLVREIDRTGRVSLPRFYAQRIKRLLPSMLLVLITVAVLARILMPPIRQFSVAWDIVASGAYVINWRLAAAAVDYFADGGIVSPLQHVWSLAVEEQFYLVWPVLLIGAALVQRRLRNPHAHTVVIALMATVTIASFVYSLLQTQSEAGLAYFSTLARGWELGLGGLLAMLLPKVRPNHRLGAVLWVGGAVAIVVAVVRLDGDTMFPGVAALLPTLGTAAIIAAGASGSGRYPQRLLTIRPARHIGRISYAWYLWHWPFVVFAGLAFGPLSPAQGLLATAASYFPALFSTQLVEGRIRHSAALAKAPSRAIRLGVACTVLAVTVGIGLHLTVPRIDVAPAAKASGAKALPSESAVQKNAQELRPSPDKAKNDKGKMHADGCLVTKKDNKSGKCVYGDPEGKKTVVLFGDSHAMQWSPALDRVAKERGWKLIGLTKSGCQPADVTSYAPSFSRGYTECDEWRGHALQRIADAEPDMVVTSSLTSYDVMDGEKKLEPKQSREKLQSGFVRTLEHLREISGEVKVIDDTPRPRSDVVDCVAGNTDKLDRCTTDAPKPDDQTWVAAGAQKVDKVDLIEPTSALCKDGTCPAVIGNVLVYRDSSHISATYAATLDRWLAEKLPKNPGR